MNDFWKEGPLKGIFFRMPWISCTFNHYTQHLNVLLKYSFIVSSVEIAYFPKQDRTKQDLTKLS